MNATQARKHLVSSLNPLCGASRFSFQRTREAFVRKMDGGTHLFHIRVLTIGNSARVEPSISIRFDDVEKMFHEAFGTPPKLRANTSTLWTEAWMLLGKRDDYVYDVHSEKQIDTVASSLASIFDPIALNYFSENSSLERVHELLNSNPTERSIFCLSEIHRCSYGLIVAARLGKPELYDLVMVYRDKMKDIDRGFHLPRFENLATVLQASGSRF